LPLPPFLRSKPDAKKPDVAADADTSVQAARTRARQRLVGSLVLLIAGVLAFPLLFETEPRPLAMNTPMKLPQRDSGVVRTAPVSAASPPVAIVAPLPADVGAEQPSTEAPTVSAVAAAAPPPVQVPLSSPESRSELKPEFKAAPAVPAPSVPAPGPALPQPATAVIEGRFVVQVGAFSDARTLREARQKVEGLGLKTYTQVIDTAAGQRTRVRVGPFASRADAEAAAKTIKGGGLPAAILTL
jgi:DedD protein